LRLQPIYDIVELIAQHGLSNVVACPGSRSAPLTLAFVRHKKLTTRIFPDERSAAFIALGMAQHTGKPTVLVCTSGSAVYNFGPAISEAFFQQTPLLIFTADRPTEWAGQQDGQTIYQQNIFGLHCKKSFQLPQEYDHPDNVWMINRIVNEAVNLTRQYPPGPVHINVPLREPLYPAKNEKIQFTEKARIINETPTRASLTPDAWQQLEQAWKKYKNVLVVVGQQGSNETLLNTIEQACDLHKLPVVADITANLHALPWTVLHADLFLGQASAEVKKMLRPDLLITFGNGLLSKHTKLFLREHKPIAHWHIQPAGDVADTFQTVTEILRCEPEYFFNALQKFQGKAAFENQKQRNYHKLWEVEERRVLRILQDFFPQKNTGEIELTHDVINALPEKCGLHLANSMSVRYANYIGLHTTQKNVTVFSNRGTSGIDGCTSTAVGHALTSRDLQILITGDLAFFYDRNAFWHNYKLPNLRIILLNNHGGTIFNLIDGPSSLPEGEEYFITQQQLTAKNLCEEFGFEYLKLDHKRKTKNLLKDFFDEEKTVKVLELESDPTANKLIFESLKEKIKKSYGT
jgi:2-succinyl-5-enolpyruvyl-6-hydroxy-3-cyclohexene-1-carboxylate synthase